MPGKQPERLVLLPPDPSDEEIDAFVRAVKTPPGEEVGVDKSSDEATEDDATE